MNLPRHAEIWAVPYARERLRASFSGSRDVARAWICIADHYEPLWRGATMPTAQERVNRWRIHWPGVAEKSMRDSSGGLPQYTFFYPEEQYHPDLVGPLAELKYGGIADVEVHIHHEGGNREEFIHRIHEFCRTLQLRHGLLRVKNNQLQFGFIHGNWALDNSLPGGRCCGLNDEIRILHELGCYADFTMPSGNSPSQARQINSIYWCAGDPKNPKSYDTGIPVLPGGNPEGDLLMITGPFGLRWGERIFPRVEFGEVAAYDPPSAYRIRRWFDLAPMIGNDLFIKVHTHGAQEENAQLLLGNGLQTLFMLVAAEARERGCQFYYVTAWEMFSAIESVRMHGDPVHKVFSERSNNRGLLSIRGNP